MIGLSRKGVKNMAPCPDRLEALWLDAYGELDMDQHLKLEKHMLGCEACREERQKMARLIQYVKENSPYSVFSPEENSARVRSIMRELRNEQRENGWGKKLFGRPWKLIPALAAASIIIVAFSWFSLKDFKNSSDQISTALKPDQQLITEDLDVIENLELLEEMDALQKLVKFVDTRQYESSRIQKIRKGKSEHDKMRV
jgi:hypothetical protein